MNHFQDPMLHARKEQCENRDNMLALYFILKSYVLSISAKERQEEEFLTTVNLTI